MPATTHARCRLGSGTKTSNTPFGTPSWPRIGSRTFGVDAADRDFAERILWNVRLHQSALAPENLTTLPHFSVSSAISLLKSAGEPGSTVPPRSASRAFIFGSARPALISLLSFSTISVGVFLGAPKPAHALASYPGR
jgi:hypothetical protein